MGVKTEQSHHQQPDERKAIAAENRNNQTIEQTKAAIHQKVESLLQMLESEDEMVHNAEQFRNWELAIVAQTDAIAGMAVEAMVKKSLGDGQLQASGKDLIKSSIDRMKNQGQRPVRINPLRGDSFEVEADYYYRAGLSKQKREKKGGSIRI